MFHKIKYQVPTAIWTFIILVLTLTPGRNVPRVPIEGLDKVVHFFLFGILAFLFLRGSFQESQKEKSKKIFLSFLTPLALGIIIEFCQNYVPGRSFSMMDILANTLGILAGITTFLLIRKPETSS